MKRYLLVFMLFSARVVSAQSPMVDSVDVFRQPKMSIGIDIMQLLDNYPAFLPHLEVQGKGDFAFQQELGPVLEPESYDWREIDKYFGIKSRSELKLYFSVKPEKRARTWLGVDFQMQFDRYEDDFWVDRGAFNQSVRSHAWRTMYGMHLRLGTQRVLADDQLILSGSVGFGRAAYNVNYSDGNGSFEDFFITDYPALDPFSANVRLQVAFALKSIRR